GVIDEDDNEMVVDRIGLGSVKSMIGHLKAAAGAASMIKIAMALRDGVLPPTLNVESPNPALNIEGSPFRIQTEARPWETRDGAPRRAGVSAFGFGGTNFHVVLEEYDPEGGHMSRKGNSSSQFFSPSAASYVARASEEAAITEGILALSADTAEELKSRFAEIIAAVATGGVSAIAPHILPLGEPNLSTNTHSTNNHRLAIVFTSVEELAEKLEKASKSLDTGKGWRVLANQGIFLGEAGENGKLAMLFPGQGTQYLGMLSALKSRFPVIAQTFDEADAIMEPVLGRPLSSIIDPDLRSVDELQAFEALMQTEVTQPAVLTVDVALYRLFRELGIEPHVVAGHSLGEYGACVAAGVMSFKDALLTVATRGTAMAQATPMNGDNGLMASIPAPVEAVQPVLDEVDGYVVCANVNCPGQTIIAGLTAAVQDAASRFEAQGLQVVMLPVSHAFHTDVVAAASAPLRSHLSTVEISSPRMPILTNVTGDYYPSGSGVEDSIRDLLAEQVAAPVQFIDLIERMYADGVRTFVEVGPKRAQTSFVKDILGERDHLALHTNHPKKGDLASLLEAVAQLWACGGLAAHSDSPTEQARGGLSVTREEIVDAILRVLCEKTGYERDEIEQDFELEADLGIDTVKQAEIMATVRDEFSLEKDETFRLAEYPTPARLADYVEERAIITTEPQQPSPSPLP
ncbi:MAG: acyltransferase domain-containing protein, partial [Bradymonadaceae bacterium]